MQQRAVRTMSYSVSKSVENIGGTAYEFGLATNKKIDGKELGGEINFGIAVSTGKSLILWVLKTHVVGRGQ